MKRVEVDNARNNRVPKSISVGYTNSYGGAWIGKTFRLSFPTDKDFNARVQKLVDNTRNVLTERGHTSFIRIGFSAIDFVNRPKIGIDSFFSKGKTKAQSSSTKLLVSGKSDKKEPTTKSGSAGITSFFSASTNPQSVQSKSPAVTSPTSLKPLHNETPSPKSSTTKKVLVGKDEERSTEDETEAVEMNSSNRTERVTAMTDEEIARRLQDSYNKEVGTQGKGNFSQVEKSLDKDEAFALQLQSTFDREHEVLSHVERFSAKRKNDASSKSQKNSKSSKRGKIDFFFKK